MSRYLLIGDPHVTPRELEDCQKLADLIVEQATIKKVEGVIFLGDLYHANSIVHTPAIEFWNNLFKRLLDLSPPTDEDFEVYSLVGNHDQFSPTIRDPHALIVHKEGLLDNVIIDRPTFVFDLGVAFMPYYADPDEFLKQALLLKERNPNLSTLICHQTFNGAKFNEGFYAKDSVDPSKVPFNIISGHIHSEHTFGNVWYPGSPRWRTLNDANQNKYIYVIDFKTKGWTLESSISTAGICKKIALYEDSAEEPCTITELDADIRVKIYGTPDYLQSRVLELKAKYKAKCATFVTRTKTAKISEQDGINESFNKYSASFSPPNKTPINLLETEVKDRLNAA
jgi:DNA repair exonuclease SbcCD nuclease subunit